MSPELHTYRSRRDPRRTPEPVPADDGPAAAGAAGPGPAPGAALHFVVQEHHASSLHWDVRLERDGVLVSWAVPRGLPLDPADARLAVHTEDHPLEYASFEGAIPAGEYGGGRVRLWDRGTYQLLRWADDRVDAVLHGDRVDARYTFVRTGGDQWLVRRRDPSPPGWAPVPQLVAPMLASAGPLPGSLPGSLPGGSAGARWSYEMKWDGVRALAHVVGGRLRLVSRSERDITATYPELRPLGDALADADCVLDGEVVAVDPSGRVSFAALQPRMQVADAAKARRLAAGSPVTYLVFDLLHLRGRDLTGRPYDERRAELEALPLTGATRFAVPPAFVGSGPQALQVSRDQGLEGVVAKRRASVYAAGARSPDWIKVKHVRTQEVLVAGWHPGAGRRSGGIGSLLLGVPDEQGRLQFVGSVGTGLTAAALADLADRLAPLLRDESPFAVPPPTRDVREAVWVEPRLVGEVAYAERTRDGRLRHPSWRGLRADRTPEQVRPEP